MVLDNSIISTTLLLDGIEYFKRYKNIQVIDVPMIVPDHINLMTSPSWIKLVHHSDGMSYVGSAEQSFLYLHEQGITRKSGNRSENTYMALTPCLRDEMQDDTHFIVFLKCELFSYNENEYIDFMNYSTAFFNRYINISTTKTVDGYDINGLKSGIELGSYGQRTINIADTELTYSYGTAFAEPRLSYVIKKEKSDV